jgi:hypothetical protein
MFLRKMTKGHSGTSKDRNRPNTWRRDALLALLSERAERGNDWATANQ